MQRHDTDGLDRETLDREMMTRCLAVAVRSGQEGEYPYGVVICRAGNVVAESTNRVAHEHDVTRHAEVVAISQAQHVLGSVSLDDCEIYTNAEPCVFCSYAIRESRIRRVVFGLGSPHMGGLSKWNVLGDTDLSASMPEVFAPPPEVVSGFMADDAERALIEWNPLVAGLIRQRGLFGAAPRVVTIANRMQPENLRNRMLRFMRRHFFDRFGRRRH